MYLPTWTKYSATFGNSIEEKVPFQNTYKCTEVDSPWTDICHNWLDQCGVIYRETDRGSKAQKWNVSFYPEFQSSIYYIDLSDILVSM